MSDLLLHWLNNDLQLSTRVSDVEADFSSGFLLGEILHRLNQQHNFTDFMNSGVADAKIINFCLLEPTMRHLNIKFDANTATCIMNGKTGAAANVLYQIKMAAERIARAPGVSTKSLDRSNIQPLHNMPTKLAKPAYNAANHYFFEHSVRRQVKSLGGLKREREAMAIEKKAKDAYRDQQARIQEQLEVTKAERLHQTFLHTQYIKTALDETDSPAWRLAIQKKNERERRKANFYQTLAANQHSKQQEQTFSLRQTVEKDLHEFERRGPSTTHQGTASAGAGGARKKSVGYGLRSLSTTLANKQAHEPASMRDPSQPVLVGDVTPELASATATIRDQKMYREKRREQFERRRKRFVQESFHHHAAANRFGVVADLEQLVQRGTHLESTSHQEMAKILIYKEIVAENRKARDANYTNRRESDANEAIDRDTASFQLLFAKYNDDWNIQSLQSADRRMARYAAQKHENQLVVGLVMQELVDFALFVAGKREQSMHSRDSGAFLPTIETWDEYRYTFAQGGTQHLSGGSLAEDAHDEAERQARHQLAQYLESFLSLPFLSQDYVGGIAKKTTALSPWVPVDWKFVAAVEILEDRYIIGEMVKYLRWLAYTATPQAPPPQVVHHTLAQPPACEGEAATSVASGEPVTIANTEVATSEAVIAALEPLAEAGISPQPAAADVSDDHQAPSPRLCILLFGPPFAGKATQAKLLAVKYDLACISVEQSLQAAITEQSPLGVEAKHLLCDGKEIDPQIYSQLVVDAIAQLGPQQRHRWILYDLPATAFHAQNLEEHLTGYINPCQIKSPFDYESQIAPGVAKPTLPKAFFHGKSGVDLVFYLDCAESSVLERCLGQLEDCETHDRDCHLLFAPPAEDATDRHRLQHANSSTNASALLSLQWLATQDFAEIQKPWFTKFDTLRDVETTESQQGQVVAITRALTVEETHTRLNKLVDAFFDQQTLNKEIQQQEIEFQEAVSMQHEENRQLKIAELKTGITLAQSDVTKAQQAVQQAEEAKAKKEEIAELRTAMDAAKKQVEAALVTARDWLVDESLRSRNAHTTFSNRLLPPLTSVFASLWDTMEREYTNALVHCFTLQRQQRNRVEARVQWMVETMSQFTRRVDKKQSLVDTFQVQFNDVIDEMRFEDATKQELHARTAVLQDELMVVVANKSRDADDELREIMSDGWVEETCQLIAVVYLRVLQAECDRFRVSLQLLIDVFFAASDEPAQLAGVLDQIKMNPVVMMELSLKVLSDFGDDGVAAGTSVAVAAAPAAAAAPTPAPKGATAKGAAAKGKPPLAPTPPVDTSGADAATSADLLAVETLLLSYDTVLQRCETLVQLVLHAPAKHDEVAKPPEPTVAAASVPHAKPGGKTGNTPAATPTATPASSVALLPRHTIDVATSNFMKAVKYEHDLMARRVRFLKESVQTACDAVSRSVRSVESTLRGVIEQRAVREDAAVASLVYHIHKTIEAETNLPLFINIQPDQVYRFPTTQHLIEDTCVAVDSSKRLVPRTPVDPAPQIEAQHDVVLNPRQAAELRIRLLGSQRDDTGALVPMCDMIQVLMALTTVPYALPVKWASCTEETLAQIVSVFADPDSGLVLVHALVDAMAQDATLVPLELHDDAAATDVQTTDAEPSMDK